MIGALAVPLLVLVHDARSRSAREYGKAVDLRAGPQGFSETLYAYASQANNNGSAFAGYTGFVQPHAPGNVGAFGITFADLLGAAAMLVGALRADPRACSRSPARWRGKRVAPPGPGTMRTDTPTFVVLLVGTILLVALLTFFPALLLGPVVQGLTEQCFCMRCARTSPPRSSRSSSSRSCSGSPTRCS